MKGIASKAAWLGSIAMVAGLAWLASRPDEHVVPLGPLHIDAARVAVLGFSSGAIMAQQVHLAYSDRIAGAVLVSGPPYHCAEGSLDLALSRCMAPDAPGMDVTHLAARVSGRAASGQLAPLDGLIGDRVRVVHGRRDTRVPVASARAALELYRALPPAAQMQLQWDGDGDFAHVWPTSEAGQDCDSVAAPYLGRCARDLAGEAVRALFGDSPAAAPAAAGELRLVQLPNTLPDGVDSLLDDRGYQYLPPQCSRGGRCGLLLVFHGCEQNAASIGDAFARDNGLNRWADVHSVVVLYPQTRATYMPLNPKACWDWWGYSGPDYDTRSGVQLRAIAGMAAALGAPLHD